MARARDVRGLAAGGLVLAAIAVLVSIGAGGVGAAPAYYYYCPYGAYTYCPPTKASPTLTTMPDPSVGTTGTPFRDRAMLSGGDAPTGTIVFRLFGPDDLLCADPPVFTDTVTVSGNGTYTSDPFTPSHSEFGTYQWTADYSGDANNNPASSACGLEPIEVLRIPAHFKGYDVDQNTPVHPAESVVLTDQFGTETVQVSQARLLWTPVEKRRSGRPAEPILREDEHQVCYVVSGGRDLRSMVRVTNQFESGNTLRVDGPTRLCAPASKSLTGPPMVPPVDTQHYKCYAVFDPSPRPEEIVDLVDQFGTQRYGVRAPQLLCNPVTKQRAGRPAEPAPRPDDHLVCYQLRRLQAFTARQVHTRDQFVTQRMRVKTPSMLCVPSEKLP